MSVYSWDQFQEAARAWAKERGYASPEQGFSAADWALAGKDPDAGMSILNAKKEYLAAGTDAKRAEANQKAERVRSSYGGYTGGKSGNEFFLEPLSPRSFEEDAAPSFSFELENDPVWQAYKKQYAREGLRAAADTLGSLAAATGGIPSTAAAAAAAQAGNDYAAQLSDKVPELERQAYERYLNELKQYNTDRAFRYGVLTDEIGAQTKKRQEALQNALSAARYAGDYSKLEELGYDVSAAPAEWEQRYQLAKLAASLGDYGPVRNDFGIHADGSVVNADLLYKLAVQQAGQGNYEALNRLLEQYLS